MEDGASRGCFHWPRPRAPEQRLRLTNAAAIVRIGSRHCKIAPTISSFPTRASMGSRARWYPRGVRIRRRLSFTMMIA